MLRIGLLGFGGIGKSAHLPPHFMLTEEGISKLVAVCDIMPERFESDIKINTGSSSAILPEEVHRYPSFEEMIEKEELDVIDICLPTFLHKEYTIKALKTGHHVLCEKPMSLCYEDCVQMCETAKKVGKKLMVGQCNRFSAPHLLLKKYVDEKTFGNVRNVLFTRFSTTPDWGWDNWFLDSARSGGAILDLHIHDIDYSRFVFGDPLSVSCYTESISSKNDVVNSRLIYKDFSATAICDWSRKGMPFETVCTIAFDKATVTRRGSVVTVAPRNGEAAYEPEITLVNYYKAEIEAFLKCIINDTEPENRAEDSALSVKLVDTLCASAEKNGEIIRFKG